MVKASLKLPNGTVVTLEGTPDDVKDLLELYGGKGTPAKPGRGARGSRKSKVASGRARPSEANGDAKPDLNEIVALAKDCDEAEAIDTQILARVGQVNRTLLPLYIVHEHLDNAFGLTSGDVNKVTTELGIPISGPHASRTLSGTASRYVIGDKVKVKGRAVLYKLSRRGVDYMKKVLAGHARG